MARQPLASVLSAALVAGVWALPHTSRACSCQMPPPPAVAAENADAVFEARVEAQSADSSSPETLGLVRYDLEVLRAWKGELGPTAQVTTRASGAACGLSVTVGKVYLFYASKRDDGELTDSSCSRTRLSGTADEDLAVLGPGNSPLGGRTVTEPTTREPPRIDPPPPDLGGPPAVEKGCAVVADPSPALAVCMLALALLGPRRRSSTVVQA